MAREQESVYRILDANANRAMEGIRTLEESFRFHWQDPQRARALKELRHALAAALKKLDRDQLLIHRDSEHDLGAEIATEAENRREGMHEVVAAAANRTQQSLRNLEEFGKIVSVEFALAIKPLRYRAYDIFSQIELHLASLRPHFDAARLYVLIDCRLPIESFLSRARSIVESGVDVLQIRDKDCTVDQLVYYARQLVKDLENLPVQLIINDRVDLASHLGLGVHLGQTDLAYSAARPILGNRLPIGISTHSLEQAQQAAAIGADYIGCGPTFPSVTKSFDQFPGLELLTQVASHVACPAFAIGGITLERLDQILDTGIRRVAVSNAIWQATDSAKAAASFRAKLNAMPTQTFSTANQLEPT